MTFNIRFTFAHENAAGTLSLVGEYPALVGSEKQVEWAGEIRSKMAREVAALICRTAKLDIGIYLLRDGAEIDALYEQIDAIFAAENGDKIKAAIDKVFSTADARYWIDNRLSSPVTMLRAA